MVLIMTDLNPVPIVYNFFCKRWNYAFYGSSDFLVFNGVC